MATLENLDNCEGLHTFGSKLGTQHEDEYLVIQVQAGEYPEDECESTTFYSDGDGNAIEGREMPDEIDDLVELAEARTCAQMDEVWASAAERY